MKLAYLLGGLPFGGIERWTFDLCQEFRQNGLVSPVVFNISGTGILMKDYLEAGIDVRTTTNSVRGIASHRLDTALHLRRQLKDYAPDIIHSMHFTANHHGRIASLGLHIPYIVHLRNTKQEKKFVRRWSDKLLSYATTGYLAVSKAVADVVQSDHNMAKRPVQVMYNAVSPSRLQHEPLNFASEYGLNGPVILSVGRYVPQKNLDLLLKATSIIRNRGINANLIMVGEGPEREKLEALRKELGLEKYVVLAGFRSDVPAFYKSSAIFAMPSDFEGLPISHLEAMYCGLPAVVSEHVPSLEIAREATLVCKLEAEDIADKLAAILTDKPLAAKMSEAAQRLVEPYTISNYAKNLFSYYQSLLQPASSTIPL